MSETQLKPCPFCGGEVEILTEEVDAISEAYNFHCDNCDMSTYYDYSNDKEEAIRHWNRRTTTKEDVFDIVIANTEQESKDNG